MICVCNILIEEHTKEQSIQCLNLILKRGEKKG